MPKSIQRTIYAILLSLLPGFYPVSAQTPGPDENTVETLPTVIVSASSVPVPSTEVGSAVTVISAQDLEEKGIRTVSDALRDVPGLAVSRSGPLGTNTAIRIRGTEANHVVVLIDGMELNNPSADSAFDFGNLLNAEIARIEILRGPQSALYGSDAIGGVISIITKRPEFGEGYSASAQGQYGSFDTLEHLYSLSYGGERFYMTAVLDQLWTDGISVADKDFGNSEKDGHENTTIRVNVGANPLEFLKIDLMGLFIDTVVDLDTGFVLPVDSPETQQTVQRFGQATTTATFFDGRWENIFKASYGEMDTTFKDPTGAFPTDTDGKKIKFGAQSNIFLSTPQLAGAEHVLSVLAERELESQISKNPFNVATLVEVINYGYAAEYRLGLLERLFLSGSVRFDDNDQLFDNELTYRATAAYLIEETDSRVHGSYGRGVKNPTLTELFGTFPGFVANPNLVAERSEGWDVGIEQTLFNGDLVIDVTWFTNYVSDLISTVFFPTFTAVNLTGKTEVHGIEVSASAEPVSGLRLDGAYTYSDATSPDGSRLLRRAKHIASVSANYGFDLIGLPANLNVNLRYNGKQVDVGPGGIGTVLLDNYFLLGMAASVKVQNSIEIFARGENLLDQNYQEVLGFGTPGISGFVGLRVNIGAR